MCARYEFKSDLDTANHRFGLQEDGLLRFPEIFPTDPVPIIIGLERHLKEAKWGYILPQAGKANKAVFNAKSETVETSPFFRNDIPSRRCLVPFSAFFEWPNKVKHRITPMSGLAAFAGLYRKDKDGLLHYTILTTEPNEQMIPVHNRMPLILNIEDERAWLDLSTDRKELSMIINTRPSQELVIQPA